MFEIGTKFLERENCEFDFPLYPLPSTQSLNLANNSFCKLALHLK
jgi:hypothetical protein